MRYFLIKNSKIVGSDLKAQKSEILSPKALNKKDFLNKSKNLII